MFEINSGRFLIKEDSSSSSTINIKILRGSFWGDRRFFSRREYGFSRREVREFEISYSIHDYNDYENFVDAIISNDISRVKEHVNKDKKLCHEGLLLTACYNTENNEIARFFIETEANLNFLSNQRNSVLTVALITLNHNLVEMILDKISMDNIINKDRIDHELNNILDHRFCIITQKIYFAFIDAGFNVLLNKDEFNYLEKSLNAEGRSFLTSPEFEGIIREQFIAVTQYKLEDVKFSGMNLLNTIFGYLILCLCLHILMFYVPSIVPIITSTFGVTQKTFEIATIVLGLSCISIGFYLYDFIYNNTYILGMNNYYASLYEPAINFCQSKGINIDEKGNYISPSDLVDTKTLSQ